MVTVQLKDTNTIIHCDDPEVLFRLHANLGRLYTFIIDGEELQKIGPTESKNPHVNAYFAGYTRGFFKKYFWRDIDGNLSES